MQMPGYGGGGGYWNILEKLAELHNCDDTPCGSTPLILGPERAKGVAAGGSRVDVETALHRTHCVNSNGLETLSHGISSLKMKVNFSHI
jgi:hypothetical protein